MFDCSNSEHLARESLFLRRHRRGALTAERGRTVRIGAKGPLTVPVLSVHFW